MAAAAIETLASGGNFRSALRNAFSAGLTEQFGPIIGGCVGARISGGSCGGGIRDAMVSMRISAAQTAAYEYATTPRGTAASAPGGGGGNSGNGPSSPYENGAPAVFTVTRSGQSLNIEVPIHFYGTGNSAENRVNVIEGIESYWSGTYGSGDERVMVTVRVTSAAANAETNYMLLGPASENSIPAALQAPGVWRCLGCRGGWVSTESSSANMRWIAAHEMGHLFGLDDRVTNTETNGIRTSTRERIEE
jgi:hypothetical protein